MSRVKKKLKQNAEFQDVAQALDGKGVLSGMRNAAVWIKIKRWYKLTAKQGYKIAQYNLGLSYQQGHGVIDWPCPYMAPKLYCAIS